MFREISRNRQKYEILNLALSLRLITFIVLLLPFNFILILSNYTSLEIVLANGIYFNIIISSKMINFRDLFEIPFKVELKMHLVAFINTVDNILLLVFVILMPYLNVGFEYLCIVYVISNIPGFLLLLFQLNNKFSYTFKIVFRNARWLMLESLPLWGFAILIGIFSQLDILILNYIKSNAEAGIYGAASRLTMPLGLVPVAIITTIFPIIIKNQKINPQKNLEIIRFVNKLLFFFSFILAVIFSFKAQELCILIFGDEFRDSYQPFILLMWANVFMFFNNFAFDLFAAFSIQKYNIIVALIIVIINVSLLLYFVQDYTYNAAAGAKILANLGGSILVFLILAKNNLYKFSFRIQEFIWCVIVLLVLYFLVSLPTIIFIFLSVVIIAIAAYLLSFFTKDEYTFIKNLLGK